MKIWFDTEFIEDGKTIDLISIGMVAEDGRGFYLQNSECDLTRASRWVKDNVLPRLAHDPQNWGTRSEIAQLVRAFAGDKPEFWAYYADYDWVVLCQLYGTMVNLPPGWPMFCRDLKQLCNLVGNPRLPAQVINNHHALVDATWVRDVHHWLMKNYTITVEHKP